MAHLSIEHFTAAAHDVEAAHYRVLAGLGAVHTEFVHNRLYPALSELIELHRTLQLILKNSHTVDNSQPRRIAGIDLENQRILFESGNTSGAGCVLELINAALPAIEQLIDEGRTIFNFIDEHVQLLEVGLMPHYIAEGYALVPELPDGDLHIYRYAVATLCESGERYRSLRTTLVRTIPFRTVSITPTSIKLELIAADPTLPNPATWCFEPEIAFPYREAVLPVVRRRLMQRVTHP